MPLYKKKKEEKYTYVIWKLTESLNELLDIMPIDIPVNIKAPSRKKEYICIRILASILNIKIEDLKHTKEGKPIISNSKEFISISHTKEYVTLLITSQDNIGIDIERYSDRVIKVAKHYLSNYEIENINKFNGCMNNITINDAFLLHWCAKEAIYKAIPNNTVEWTKDIICYINKDIINKDETSSKTQFEAIAKCYKNTVFNNIFEITKEYCLVISIQK